MDCRSGRPLTQHSTQRVDQQAHFNAQFHLDSDLKTPCTALWCRRCVLKMASHSCTDDSSIDLQRQLKDFEARCDRSNPEQAALLDSLREHTRRLQQARGEWGGAPGSGDVDPQQRLWNAPQRGSAKPPESLR